MSSLLHYAYHQLESYQDVLEIFLGGKIAGLYESSLGKSTLARV